MKKLIRWIRFALSDEACLGLVEIVETLMAKVLTLIMLVVILVSVFDVSRAVLHLITEDYMGYLKSTLFEIFGLFLTVLIALEIIENITGYLKKHEFQVELVIATSLIAVARKIIIFDISKPDSGIDLLGLSATIFALSLSYWIVRQVNHKQKR